MARGPKPKAPAKRARRNKASTSAALAKRAKREPAERPAAGSCAGCGGAVEGKGRWCDECKATRVRAPSLPKMTFEDGSVKPWHLLTVKWWRDVWHSEMAPEYVESDMHGLYRLAMLVDAFYRKPSTSLSAEIRLLAGEYGLAPLARRRLDWTTKDGKSKRGPGRSTGPPPPGTDPRTAWRMVK